MRCTRCGTEAPPTDTDAPVEWAARGPDDEEVRCLECIIGAQQSTEPRPVDALGMATLRRRPEGDSTILHSDHGTQYTSWAFGQRLRAAGLLPSMGTIGDCYDNSMMESFWGTLQLEVLDTRIWETRDELANAIFEWIECWYNTERRHSSLGMLRPVEFEALYTDQTSTQDDY
jgi:putative transposase